MGLWKWVIIFRLTFAISRAEKGQRVNNFILSFLYSENSWSSFLLSLKVKSCIIRNKSIHGMPRGHEQEF